MNLKSCKSFILPFFLLLIVGCGFHLRGKLSIPPYLQTLQISPNVSFDSFQRVLRQNLKNNDMKIIEPTHPEAKTSATLILLSQSFSERVIAFGSDGQTNRVILQFTVNYQVMGSEGQSLIPVTPIQVERELMVNPNAVLGTETERERLKIDLYMDAASQMIRQLSAPQL